MSDSKNKRYPLVFLHKYGRKAASFRYRFEQYFQAIEIELGPIKVQSLFKDSYLENLYSNGQRSLFLLIQRYIARIFYLLINSNRKNFYVVYMELFPQFPYFFEALFLKNGRYIVELDDAFYLKYENSILSSKVQSLLRNAAGVIAGSQFLTDYAQAYNKNVIRIPSVMDLQRFKMEMPTNTNKSQVVVGWIGSPSTSKELLLVEDALKYVSEKYLVKFLIIGSSGLNLNLSNVEYRPWREDREIENIFEMDIGIMPLEDDQWNKGKCAFKIVQYMAAGKAVLASSVGENSIVIQNDVNGLLADSNDQWKSQLERLVQDFELRKRLGTSARQKVEDQHSLKLNAQRYVAFISKSL